MNIRQLATFVTVVECQSFTLAGKRMFMSQPTVSSHIKSLEEELDVELIERNTKSFKVTDKGRDLYEFAVTTLHLHQQMLQQWYQHDHKILNIGSSTIPSAYILPTALAEYKHISPEAYFVVHQGDSAEIADGVAKGVYDIGVVGMPFESELYYTNAVCEDHIVIITPVTEEFLSYTDLPTPPYEKLFAHPIILREEGSATKRRAEMLLRQLGINETDLNISARVNDQEAIKNLVAGGLGISIISEMAARNFVQEHRVLQFSVPKEVATRNLYVLLPHKHHADSLAANFARYLCSGDFHTILEESL